MNYRFISFSFNVASNCRLTKEIWQEVKTGNYYIDEIHDVLIDPGFTDIHKNYYKEHLSSDAKKISLFEKILGVIEYKGSRWDFICK